MRAPSSRCKACKGVVSRSGVDKVVSPGQMAAMTAMAMEFALLSSLPERFAPGWRGLLLRWAGCAWASLASLQQGTPTTMWRALLSVLLPERLAMGLRL